MVLLCYGMCIYIIKYCTLLYVMYVHTLLSIPVACWLEYCLHSSEQSSCCCCILCMLLVSIHMSSQHGASLPLCPSLAYMLALWLYHSLIVWLGGGCNLCAFLHPSSWHYVPTSMCPCGAYTTTCTAWSHQHKCMPTTQVTHPLRVATETYTWTCCCWQTIG